MGAQAKIINMLLYDGTLGGVIRIEDSNWNAGELFSAPRDSVSDLLKTGACNKYGVYLLLSSNMVYVGQSSDLAKRLSQHMAGKDWWESAVIITTKDDSLNHSDIDYLENVLIDKAMAFKKLDCDNKKSGNPPKVDIFRKVFLGQYLEEALFLMQLIGIRVFSENNGRVKKRGAKKAVSKQLSIQAVNTNKNDSFALTQNNIPLIPDLPDVSMKIGAFVYEAMKRLAESGYVFSENAIDDMCTPSWSKETFHTSHPFMKRYYPGTDNKGTDGYVRFKKDPYTFGKHQVLISKEWYENQRDIFISWYVSLSNQTSSKEASVHPRENTSKEHIWNIPDLPDHTLKAGKFVRQAMETLSKSGYEFSDQAMEALCKDGAMKKVIGMQRNLPFFKLVIPGDEKGHMIDGRPRYYSEPLTFGKYQVYLCSQIYENDKGPFIKWYERLMRGE